MQSISPRAPRRRAAGFRAALLGVVPRGGARRRPRRRRPGAGRLRRGRERQHGQRRRAGAPAGHRRGEGRARSSTSARSAAPSRASTQLREVKGIGDAALERIRPHVALEGKTTLNSQPASGSGGAPAPPEPRAPGPYHPLRAWHPLRPRRAALAVLARASLAGARGGGGAGAAAHRLAEPLADRDPAWPSARATRWSASTASRRKQQPEVAGLPTVGGLYNPSLEAVVALAPDLVVFVPTAEQRDFQRRLEELGARRRGLRPGELRGRARHHPAASASASAGEEAARERVAAIRARAARGRGARRRAAAPARRAVLQREPLFVVGRGSFVDEMLGAAGAENLGRAFAEPWPRVTQEWLLAAAPEVILDGSDVSGDAARATGRAGPRSPRCSAGAWWRCPRARRAPRAVARPRPSSALGGACSHARSAARAACAREGRRADAARAPRGARRRARRAPRRRASSSASRSGRAASRRARCCARSSAARAASRRTSCSACGSRASSSRRSSARASRRRGRSSRRCSATRSPIPTCSASRAAPRSAASLVLPAAAPSASATRRCRPPPSPARWRRCCCSSRSPGGRGRLSPTTLLLIGVVFNAFASAAIVFLASSAGLAEGARIFLWLIGNLSDARIEVAWRRRRLPRSRARLRAALRARAEPPRPRRGAGGAARRAGRGGAAAAPRRDLAHGRRRGLGVGPDRLRRAHHPPPPAPRGRARPPPAGARRRPRRRRLPRGLRHRGAHACSRAASCPVGAITALVGGPLFLFLLRRAPRRGRGVSALALAGHRASRWAGVRCCAASTSLSSAARSLGLVGRNGAGKTTLLRVASGVLAPGRAATSGSAGAPRGSLSRRAFARQRGGGGAGECDPVRVRRRSRWC